MARRRRPKHEEHLSHEAWAIPYGDLITLLLAFFVVMYAISSVNEGKYRVLSDSLYAAFRGTPRTMEPIQVGEKQVGSGADVKTTLVEQSMLTGQPRKLFDPVPVKTNMPRPAAQPLKAGDFAEQKRTDAQAKALERVADEVVRAMDSLEKANLVFVRRKSSMIEVEIRTDILYPSGSATLSPSAVPIIERLAQVLKPFPNPIRVEGHTDSRPINTIAFPSNWELSAARAASVVHLFQQQGVDPVRLSVIGHAEFKPAQPNTTAEGRNANRRVVIVILSSDGALPDGVPAQAADGVSVEGAVGAPDGERGVAPARTAVAPAPAASDLATPAQAAPATSPPPRPAASSDSRNSPAAPLPSDAVARRGTLSAP